MEGKEAIVGRIISDAEKKAAERKAEAVARADAALADAKARAGEYLANGRRVLEKEAAEIVARRETVAGLDRRKLMLAAKRGAVEAALARALEIARAFDKKKYLSVLEDLLQAYAEEGDAAELAADAPVSDREFTSCKAFTEKKLRFAGRNESLAGGVRLENDVCVKDLSFRALLEANRNELEREIAAAVFPAEQ